MADDQSRYPPQNQAAYRPADYEGEADGPNLGQLAATLWRRKAMIIGVVVLGTGLAGLAGLSANKAVVIPGAMNKVGAQGARFLPRAVIRRIAGALK